MFSRFGSIVKFAALPQSIGDSDSTVRVQSVYQVDDSPGKSATDSTHAGSHHLIILRLNKCRCTRLNGVWGTRCQRQPMDRTGHTRTNMTPSS